MKRFFRHCGEKRNPRGMRAVLLALAVCILIAPFALPAAATEVELSPEIAGLPQETAAALIAELEAIAKVMNPDCYFADLDGDGASELLVNGFHGSDYAYSVYDWGNGTLEAIVEWESVISSNTGGWGYAQAAVYQGEPVVVIFTQTGETGDGARTENVYTVYDAKTHKQRKQLLYRQISGETQKLCYVEGSRVSEVEFAVALEEFEEILGQGRKIPLFSLVNQLRLALGMEPNEQKAPYYARDEITFTRRYVKDEAAGCLEYAVIAKYGETGIALWEYTTDAYPAGEGFRISEAEANWRSFDDGRYYFSENGTLVALDKNTGEVVWKNEDFGGTAAACYTVEDGTTYFCGYTGPYYFAVDANGRTLNRIESFGEGYSQAYQIFESDGDILVMLDWGPDKELKEAFYDRDDSGEFDYKAFYNYIADFYFLVNCEDGSYSMLEY